MTFWPSSLLVLKVTTTFAPSLLNNNVVALPIPRDDPVINATLFSLDKIMDIENIEIKIKKYDREKEVVILNLIYNSAIEERGWTVRLLETKAEPKHSLSTD